MKRFIKASLMALIVSLAFVSIQAQTLVQKNSAETLKKSITTPSNTATKVDSLTIANNEAGYFQVKVVGLHTGGPDDITGTLQYKYSKAANGTLTLGPGIAVDSLRVDSDISGATFAAVASNNNIKINVTGVTSKPIRWTVIVKQWARRND